MASTFAVSLSPRLQPTTVPPGTGGPRRPRLRVLEGGLAPGQRAQRAVYRRRRIVASVLVLVVALALVLLAHAAVARIAGSGGGAVAAPAAGAPSAGQTVHIVQPGDTLWSIAEGIAPGVDVRVTVEVLKELNGSARLVPGQAVRLP